MESQIIDATTEDGKKMLHEIEEQEKLAKEGLSGAETDTTTKGKDTKGKEPVRETEKEEENPLALEID